MDVHHIVPHINKGASGYSYTVPALCKALIDYNVSVTLHTTGEVSLPATKLQVKGYKLKFRYLNKLYLSYAMYLSLLKSALTADIFHINSLWVAPSIYPGYILRNNKHCKLLLSPRGTLSSYAWNWSRTKKRLVWFFGQYSTLKRVDCFHATSMEEYRDIRRRGFTQPVAIIPNGIDIPLRPNSETELLRKNGSRRLLFLARIHPIKGIDNLLHAWKNIESKFPEWELLIVGPDDDKGCLSKLKKLSHDLSLTRVDFAGPSYGADKDTLYWNSDLYILPSHSENFAITVAEALAHELPVIVSTGAPWSRLEEKQCGWWIDNDPESLTEALQSAMTFSDQELSLMGSSGREWMEEEFSWERVARMTLDTYEWLINGGIEPDWVIVN